jgi:hypothetical protein
MEVQTKGRKKMKKITGYIIMALLLFANNIFANEIYVEQVGDSSTVTITQDGTGNAIGDSLVAAFMGGGSNTVAIEQIGDNNTLAMIVNGASTNTTVTTHGSGNLQSITCGSTGTASCSGSTIKQIITGDDNTVTTNLGTGGNHISEITVLGDTNIITHSSTNTGATTAYITATGNTNTIGVTQSGTLAKSVSVSSTGNSNSITINQSN